MKQSKVNVETHRALKVRVPRNLRNIRVILAEPQTPGNVGATARAVKTMGISDLVVIKGCAFRGNADAVKMAHGAVDVLESARVVSSLAEATEGLHLLVGTTHRARGEGLPPIRTARDAAAQIATVSKKHRVGILFGREDSGLTNDELIQCHVIASIPAARRHPSLNLSQAVMVFCYEVFQASLVAQPKLTLELAETHELDALYAHIVRTLKSVGFRPYHDDPETFIRSLRRVFSRGLLEKRDVKTMHRIFAQFDVHMKQKK